MRSAIGSFDEAIAPAAVSAPVSAPVAVPVSAPVSKVASKTKFNQAAAIREAIALQQGGAFTVPDLVKFLAKSGKPVTGKRVSLELWNFRTKAKPPLIEFAQVGPKGGKHSYRAVKVASAGSIEAAVSPAKAPKPANQTPAKTPPKKSPGASLAKTGKKNGATAAKAKAAAATDKA